MSKSSLDYLDHWKLFSAKLQATNRAASIPWAFRAGPPSGKMNTCLEYTCIPRASSFCPMEHLLINSLYTFNL